MAFNDRGSKNVIIYNESGVYVGDITNPLIVSEVDTAKATYSSVALNITPATTPTDMFTITGSATKTIRVQRISISGTQTTAAIRDILFIKRSTANSAGTSTTLTAVPHDSLSAAATATVRSYTANPTLGNTVGTVRVAKLLIAATSVAVAESVFDWGPRYGQSIVLRGTGEVFSINLNSITSTGGSFTFSIEWTEE